MDRQTDGWTDRETDIQSDFTESFIRQASKDQNCHFKLKFNT